MSNRLRILHLEDDMDYARFVQELLARGGVEADVTLVTHRAEFDAALAREKFDLILADFSLPEWTGLQALSIVKERFPQMPFLLVSGTIGEQTAIESLKSGATDYVLKQWPDRLVPAVRRALSEAEERARREQAETELFRREKYFRALTLNSLDLLTVLSDTGDYKYHSPSVKHVLGYEPEELAGRNVFSLIHPEDVPRARAAFQFGLEHPDQSVKLEYRIRHRDGRYIYLEAVGQNRLNDPDIAAVVVNSRDVSERKLAESALRSSEMLFHSVWENSVDGMRLTDENGIIVAVNNAFCKLVGLMQRELSGKPFTIILAPAEQPDLILNRYREQFRDRTIERQVERRMTLHNGSACFLEERSTFVELRGQPPLLLGLFRDVSQQKRLEEQFRQVQKMEAVGQLAGGVAHDFNNILTVIHGHASMLQLGANLSPTAAKSAQQIVSAAERAAGLTRQLLTFSRRQMLQPQRLDLNEIVANVTKMLSRLLGEHVGLQVSASPEPAWVLADATMIDQVVMNLAVNARDAMPHGGQLSIGVSLTEVDAAHAADNPEARPGRFVCLTARDTGVGIAPEILRRIFEPFFSTKEVGKGTGLGLATVYGVVKQHQGWIEVESQPGQGASFRVYLPFSAGLSEKAEERPVELAARGGNETILVVEDEAAVRELVCDILEGQGYQVLVAASGVKALQVWAEHQSKVDLVITDLVMPEGINGRELAEELWKERPNLKVIFSSGYSADVIGKEFTLKEGSIHLQKPYQPKALAKVVRDCLDPNGGRAKR
jgi:PAS domain S-box-containing protein